MDNPQDSFDSSTQLVSIMYTMKGKKSFEADSRLNVLVKEIDTHYYW